jgi:hypothetical protein
MVPAALALLGADMRGLLSAAKVMDRSARPSGSDKGCKTTDFMVSTRQDLKCGLWRMFGYAVVRSLVGCWNNAVCSGSHDERRFLLKDCSS